MTLLYILLASLAVSLISFAGTVIIYWRKLNSTVALSFLVNFAAGSMLAVAFLDLLPEALEGQPKIAYLLNTTLLAIVLFFFLERFVLWFHHHDEEHGVQPSAILILAGDGVHNFIDGITIAAAFLVSPALGLATTLAIIAHEIPQEIADFSVMVHGGLSQGKAILYNFFSALTALIGAVGGYYFLAKLQNALPIFVSFAAGMFIYIACSDLIPDLHKEFKQEKRWLGSVPFILGIVALALIIRFLEG